MRRFVGILLFAPLALVLGIFAVENDTPVTLEVWPFAASGTAWASVWILGLLAVGIVIGMLIGWLSGMGWRHRARRAERRLRDHERQARLDEDAGLPGAPGSASNTAPNTGPNTGPNTALGTLPAAEARVRRTALLGD